MKIQERNIQRVCRYLLLLVVIIATSLIIWDSKVYAIDSWTGTINGTGVNFRTGPGTSYGSLGKVNKGDNGVILEEAKDDGGSSWYKMIINNKEGWIYASYVDAKVTSVDFKEYLTRQGFPESYHDGLTALHAKYPNWIFEAQHTNLTWDEVITAENKLGRSLVSKGSIASWKSTQTGAYNWETGTWVTFDGGSWVAASEELIKYYVDPRNFFDDTYVFQFLRQSYDASMDYAPSLTAMFSKSTYWSTPFEEDGKTKTFVETLLEAGANSGVSPYTIASTIIQEQGWEPTSDLISGASGYYNYFNAGAYEEGDMSPAQRGIWYASQNDASNLRPWTTRTKAITGGAMNYGKNYVGVGQDTIYLKKFDVVDQGGLYNHQYMTHIRAAASEGKLLADAFWADAAKESTSSGALVFKIPIYKNMPATVCPLPTGDGSPNYMLQSLSVGGQSLTPTFSMYETAYSVIVPHELASVTISASAFDGSATISGAGSVNLEVGTNTCDVTVTAPNGGTRTYTIKIIRDVAGNPNVTQSLVSTAYSVNNDSKTVTGITNFPISVADFSNSVTPINGVIRITKADGSEQTGNVGTGSIVSVYDAAGTLKSSYSVLIYGDTSGDGNVNALDLLRVQKNILGMSKLNDMYFKAGDTSKNGKIDALDLLQVQKQIIGAKAISQ